MRGGLPRIRTPFLEVRISACFFHAQVLFSLAKEINSIFTKLPYFAVNVYFSISSITLQSVSSESGELLVIDGLVY